MNLRKLFVSALAALAIPASCLAESRIEINLPAHMLTVYEDGQSVGSYPVAIGKYSTPTPTGEFSIINMEVDPIWTDPETMESVESGDWNPLGYRWMGFYGRYGIHGNSNPDSIGSSVSNGCVRMYNEDVESVFEVVDVGTPVDIIYERVFIERDANNQVALHIYDDCYDEQPLSVGDINSLLKNYGVDGFLSDDEIEAALEDGDGEPIYIAGTVPLFVNLKDTGSKVVQYKGNDWLPIMAIAKETGIDVGWDASKNEAFSSFARIPCESLKGTVFSSNWEDVEKLFGMKVRVDKKTGAFHILSAVQAAMAEAQHKDDIKKQPEPMPEQKMEVAPAENVPVLNNKPADTSVQTTEKKPDEKEAPKSDTEIFKNPL